MKPSLILGPYILPTHTAEISATEINPLGFAIEWASLSGARRISLFRHRPAHAPQRTRLENVVLSAKQLPFNVECPEYQRVELQKETYIPLESLLLSLYNTHDVGRPIFAVLRELVSCVPLHSAVLRPILKSGLLASAAEERGYRLNTLLLNSGQLVADISWNPPGTDYRFHASLCAFGASDDEGEWRKPGLLGASHLLSDELQRLVQGPPLTLFSAEGVRLLSTYLRQLGQVGTAR